MALQEFHFSKLILGMLNLGKTLWDWFSRVAINQLLHLPWTWACDGRSPWRSPLKGRCWSSPKSRVWTSWKHSRRMERWWRSPAWSSDVQNASIWCIYIYYIYIIWYCFCCQSLHNVQYQVCPWIKKYSVVNLNDSKDLDVIYTWSISESRVRYNEFWRQMLTHVDTLQDDTSNQVDHYWMMYDHVLSLHSELFHLIVFNL